MSTVFTLVNTLPQVTTTSPVVGTVPPTYTALVAGSTQEIKAGSVAIQKAIGQRGTGSLTVKSALGAYWQYGTQVVINDETGATAYAGFVSRDHAYRDHGAKQGDGGWLWHDLTLMDNKYKADKRTPFGIYNNVTAGSIVLDLVGKYLAAEGVTTTATSVATGPTIVQAIWAGGKTCAGALTWLAQQSGYWWDIDDEMVLWFLPYGGVGAPFAIDGTNVDAMQDVTVDYDNDMMVNKQYVKGSTAQKGSSSSPLVETFKGDGASRSFILSYELNTLISATLNAVDITSSFGDKGTSGSSYYGLVGDPVIAQDPSQTVLTSSDSLVISYIGQYPVLTSAQNSALIAAQKARERTGSGIIESVYSDTKVRSLPAAFQIANAQLTHYGADTAVITYTTKTKGLQPGQLQNVTLSDYGLANLPMLIAAVSISDQNDNQNIWFQVAAIGAPSSDAWALESAQFTTFWQSVLSQTFDPSDLTDAQDTSLALQATSVAARTATVTITPTKLICSFPSSTTFPSSSLFPC